MDASGLQGQLIDFDEAKSCWSVATFGAEIVEVAESSLRRWRAGLDRIRARPLTAEDLQDYDVTLGPASDVQVMGAELTERLSEQGCALEIRAELVELVAARYAVCKLFVSVEDLEEMSRTAERWGSFLFAPC